MRVLITGVKDGKSCVVEEIECSGPGDERVMKTMQRVTVAELPPKPEGRGTFYDLKTPPGVLRWLSVWFPPGEFIENHSSDTYECHTVLAGGAELILDEGTHQIRAGDSIAITGVDHAWRAGPEGCRSSIVVISTPPR